MNETESTRPDPFTKAPKQDRKEIIVPRPWQYLQLEKCALKDLQLEELWVDIHKTRDLSPMERWEQEPICEQPWHTVGIVGGGCFCEISPAEEVNGADKESNRATYYTPTNHTDSGKGKG